VAILLYRIFTALFFQQTMEGEIIVCLLLARK
jgi:hypothetical protein